MSSLQLSIVIPTIKGSDQLHATLHSILQQQAPPSFEVIVVSNFPHTELEQNLLRWDRRFKYFCSGELGVNKARNEGLNQARGEIVLFLDDDMWIEDKLFLKKHYDSHQKYPSAIGVGGPCALKRNANVFEAAYHWILNSNLYLARIDEVRCTELAGGNSSFKTLALKSAFEFEQEIDFGGAATDLHARLTAAGLELVFNEKLLIEHRPRFEITGFIKRAYMQGRSTKVRQLQGIQPSWRFYGTNATRERYMQEHSGVMTRGLRFAFWLYDFVASAAKNQTSQMKYLRHISGFEIAKSLLRECKARIKALPESVITNELYLALRYSVFGR